MRVNPRRTPIPKSSIFFYSFPHPILDHFTHDFQENLIFDRSPYSFLILSVLIDQCNVKRRGGDTGSAFFLSFSFEEDLDFVDFLEDGILVLVVGGTGSLSLSAIEEISGLSSYSDSLEHLDEEMGRFVMMY
jgi:hypothetical protein